jgi:cobalamin synthase
VTALLGTSSIVIALLYNHPPRPLQKTLTTSENIARLNWVAYILLAVVLTLFTIGLSWGDNPYSWSNPHVIAPLVVGGAFMIALFVHQMFIKKDGLVHHDLFKGD